MRSEPLVSIGIPVFNGENYLSHAIESALNQSYENIEIIISNNGSTDNTQLICGEYLKMDSRIKYYRFKENVGASKNFNQTFALSKGKYFRWLPHDDILDPTNISKSVNILESYDDFVLCGSQKKIMNSQGEVNKKYDLQGLKLNKEDPVLRYKLLLKYFAKSFGHADFVLSLIRRTSLQKTNLIGNFPCSDFTLLSELILEGKFYVIDEPLFLRRLHSGVSVKKNTENPKNNETNKTRLKSINELAKWFDPNSKIKYIPHFKWVKELKRNAKNRELNGSDKIRIIIISYKWFFMRLFVSTNNLMKRKLLKIYK